MSIRTLAAIAAGGLVMTLAAGPVAPAYAQQSNSVDADANIVRELSIRNLLELRLAQLAGKKSSNASVKAFAERMRTDHLELNRQLGALVGQDGKPFRIGLGKMEPQVAELRQLEKPSGSQFDQQYMSSMIRHHQDNVGYYQSTSTTAQSAQVRTLLANNLPVLQQHLSLAMQVGNQVGAGGVVATGQNPTPPTQYPAPPTQYPTPPTQTQPQQPSQNPLPPSQYPVAAPSVPAASEATPPSRAEVKAFKKDAKFVRNAMADNTLEIRLAQFAQRRATQNSVRQLAQRIETEHTAMQNRWIALGASNGMKLKAGMGRRHTDKAERVEKIGGADFDRAYLTMLIQNNQDYLEYFEKEGRATRSGQVRSEAARDVPTLRHHQDWAKQIGVQVGVDTTAALKARKLAAYRQ